MKSMKRTIALLMALAMVFTMGTTVFAAGETYDITVPAGDSHTYEVYQIFTGTLADGKLASVKWGKNGSGAEGASVSESILDELTAVAASTSDKEKLAVITKYVDLTAADKFGEVSANSPLNNVPAGYYLLKDVDGSLDGEDDAYTTYIVQVVDDVTVVRKVAKPSVDKAVKDEEGWGETADHAINESFQFSLTATLPADTDFAAYDTYAVKFTDTMSDGITFEDVVSAKINGVYLRESDCVYTGMPGQAGGSWSLEIADIKAFGIDLTNGAVIEIVYSAHLNENAKLNNDAENKNSVVLEYSNNPNGSGTGKTGPDNVWVFTYKVDNTKYANEAVEGKELAGAEFTLYEADGETVFGLIYDEAMKAYRPVKAGETAAAMVSAADGTFNIAGLDAGTYVLKETKVPDGYNACEDITVVISAVHEESADGQSASVSFEGSSHMENAIIDKSGSELPETGGIGTTIFYVLGAVLMIGAAVLLITKKRLSVEK